MLIQKEEIACCLRARARGAPTSLAATDLTVVALGDGKEHPDSEDHVGRFLADRCRLGSGLATTSRELRGAYKLWCEAEDEDPMSARALGVRLTDRGIQAIRDSHGIRGRGWRGLDLATDATLRRQDA